MDELERLGRHAFERAGQVAVETLQRAWDALWPLVEQMLARLEALNALLRPVLIWLMQIWLQIQLQPAFDKLAQHIADTVVRLMLIGLLIVAAVGVLWALLAIIVAVIVGRIINPRP